VSFYELKLVIKFLEINVNFITGNSKIAPGIQDRTMMVPLPQLGLPL